LARPRRSQMTKLGICLNPFGVSRGVCISPRNLLLQPAAVAANAHFGRGSSRIGERKAGNI
jgi:hypothetical protein